MMDCRVIGGAEATPSFGRLCPAMTTIGDWQASVGPGEGDLVERFRPESFRGARHHAAAERAIELGGGVVVGKRPDHHAFQPTLREVALGRSEQAAAEAEPL